MRTQAKPKRLSVFLLLIFSLLPCAYASGKKASDAGVASVDTLHSVFSDSSSVKTAAMPSHTHKPGVDEEKTEEEGAQPVTEQFVPEHISWMYTNDGIQVQHLPEGASLAVMNLHGRKVLTMDDVDEELLLPLVEKGIFILQIHYGDKMVAYRIRN